MANAMYNKVKGALGNGDIDWVNDTTIKVMLLTNSYTLNVDHDFVNDVNSYEVSGTGYTAGGKAITSRSITIDNADDNAQYDAADVEWTTSTITAYKGVVYKDTGTASTSPLICYLDFGGSKESSNGAAHL